MFPFDDVVMVMETCYLHYREWLGNYPNKRARYEIKNFSSIEVSFILKSELIKNYLSAIES